MINQGFHCFTKSFPVYWHKSSGSGINESKQHSFSSCVLFFKTVMSLALINNSDGLSDIILVKTLLLTPAQDFLTSGSCFFLFFIFFFSKSGSTFSLSHASHHLHVHLHNLSWWHYILPLHLIRVCLCNLLHERNNWGHRVENMFIDLIFMFNCPRKTLELNISQKYFLKCSFLCSDDANTTILYSWNDQIF